MELLPGLRNDCEEGNISWFPERQKTLIDIISERKPKNLIQIGFNMGHSALLICDIISQMKNNNNYGDDPISIHVFDICEHECTIPNFNILAEEAKKQNIYLNLIPGSSLETVPRFMMSNDLLFDFIEIDGCHTFQCLIEDVMNTVPRLKVGGIVYIDDYMSTKGPIPSVNKGIDTINWEGFNTWYIDGAFWAEKKESNITNEKIMSENYEHVNHPSHYGGETNPYEAIKVIDAWDLGFSLGNTVKYISRAGKKGNDKELQDLKKALWYLQHHIEQLENEIKS
jgi:predicted O-methyltransferase YrrM